MQAPGRSFYLFLDAHSPLVFPTYLIHLHAGLPASQSSVCASSLPFGVGNTPSCVWALASVVFCITILSSEVLLRPRPSHNPLGIPPGFHCALQRAVLKWTHTDSWQALYALVWHFTEVGFRNTSFPTFFIEFAIQLQIVSLQLIVRLSVFLRFLLPPVTKSSAAIIPYDGNIFAFCSPRTYYQE